MPMQIQDFKPRAHARSLKKYSVVDIETTIWDEGVEADVLPEFIGYYDGEEYRTFHHDFNARPSRTCVEEFLRFFITKPHRNEVCYAHGGGKFDFLPIFADIIFKPDIFIRFLSKEPETKVIPLKDGSLLEICIILDKHRWYLRDSMKLLPGSLRSLTRNFDVKHKKSHMPKVSYDDDPALWERYNRIDCIGLYEVITAFKNAVEGIGGGVRRTISSTAMEVYACKYLKHVLASYPSYEKKAREGYFGGRTEIYTMYAPPGKHHYVDINSTYLSVMHDNVYPIGIPHYTRMEPGDYAGQCGFATGYIKIPLDVYLPAVPYRAGDGHILYPVGLYEGTWDFAILEHCYDMGWEFTVKDSWIFNDAEPIFKEFADDMWRERLQAKKDKNYSLFTTLKQIGNSVYGKWAEGRDREQFIVNPDEEERGRCTTYEDSYDVFKRDMTSRASHILPSISSRVTAKAQLLLWEYMDEALQHDKTLYYCDTDSIMSDYRYNTDAEKLGGLKDELDSFDEGIWVQPKTYILHTDDTAFKKKYHTSYYRRYKGAEAGKCVWNGYKKALKNDFRGLDVSRTSIAPFRTAFSFDDGRLLRTVVRQKGIRTPYVKRLVGDDYQTAPHVMGNGMDTFSSVMDAVHRGIAVQGLFPVPKG